MAGADQFAALLPGGRRVLARHARLAQPPPSPSFAGYAGVRRTRPVRRACYPSAARIRPAPPRRPGRWFNLAYWTGAPGARRPARTSSPRCCPSRAVSARIALTPSRAEELFHWTRHTALPHDQFAALYPSASSSAPRHAQDPAPSGTNCIELLASAGRCAALPRRWRSADSRRAWACSTSMASNSAMKFRYRRAR